MKKDKFGQYSTAELTAKEQPLELLQDIKDYLNKNGIQVGENSYLLDSGIAAGVLSLEEEINFSKGVKADVEVGVTARTTNLGSLVKQLKTRFPQLKDREDSKKPAWI